MKAIINRFNDDEIKFLISLINRYTDDIIASKDNLKYFNDCYVLSLVNKVLSKSLVKTDYITLVKSIQRKLTTI